MNFKQIHSEILEIYKNNLRYEFKENIQEIEFDIDIENLRKEIFDIIIKGDHGFNSVAVKTKKIKGSYQWEDDENRQMLYDMSFNHLESGGDSIINDELFSSESNTAWHPLLSEDSYVKKLTNSLEEFSGVNISQVVLSWMLPNTHQAMHMDFETLRFHVPLMTNNDVWFLQDKKSHFMEYGKLYHLSTISNHAVANYGITPRLHLIFSTYLGSDIQDKLKKLGTLDITEENIFSSVNNGGFDKYSLSQLTKIYASKKNQTLSNLHNKDCDRKWIKTLTAINKKLR